LSNPRKAAGARERLKNLKERIHVAHGWEGLKKENKEEGRGFKRLLLSDKLEELLVEETLKRNVQAREKMEKGDWNALECGGLQPKRERNKGAGGVILFECRIHEGTDQRGGQH